MSSRDVCPEGLVWLSDGHVSDWVLNALVDAEVSLLPEAAVSHVDTCEHCTDRMAHMAAMAFALGEELSHLVEQEASRKAPFPRALFGTAFLAFVSFALFSVGARGGDLGELPHELLTVWRGLRLAGPFAFQRLGVVLVILSCSSALIAIVGGVLLARWQSFPRNPESPS